MAFLTHRLLLQLFTFYVVIIKSHGFLISYEKRRVGGISVRPTAPHQHPHQQRNFNNINEAQQRPLLPILSTPLIVFTSQQQQQQRLPTFRASTHLRAKALPSTTSAIRTASTTISNSSPGTLALAGKLFKTIRKFFIGPEAAKKILIALRREAHYGDIAVLLTVGFGVVPLSRCIRRTLKRRRISDRVWQSTPLYRFAKGISQLSIIGGVVYFVDMLGVALNAINVKINTIKWSTIVAHISVALWAAGNVAAVKHMVLTRLTTTTNSKNDAASSSTKGRRRKRGTTKTHVSLGKTKIIDRLLNAVIWTTAVLFILDMLELETGRAIGSIFALGSVGTLIFSLASKDLATDFVSGLALGASNKFYEGDEVRIGTEHVGYVHKMSWMTTEIRGYDEIITKIPNSQVAGLKEIDNACGPKLVRDGSRPFRCHWREFHEEKLQVVIDTHFMIQHGTQEYYNMRQTVLEAIARAAKKNHVQFAVPILSIQQQQQQKNDDGDGEDNNNNNTTTSATATTTISLSTTTDRDGAAGTESWPIAHGEESSS